MNRLDRRLEEAGFDPMKACGFDDAAIGVVERCGQPPILVYDLERCVEILVRRDGMDEHDAREFLDFNAVQSWLVPGTPGWLTLRLRR